MEPTMTHASELAYATDLLKCAQVTTDYQELAFKLAGPLADTVKSVFPGHLLLVYLLTDTNRRQVWNAYLSSPRIASQMPTRTAGDWDELRVRLLICRSYALIVDGYGSSERGLIGLYGKLGQQALAPEFYRQFHSMLTANETLRRSLAHLPTLDHMALSLLFTHPPELQSYPLALKLIKEDNPEQFRELHDHLQRLDFAKKDALMVRLYRVACAGREFRIVLAEIQQALPFPPQAAPDEGPLRFIRNSSELIDVADQYRNCLRSHVADAFSGESQFYEWRCPTPAIVCLKRQRGAWYIAAIGIENNEESPEALNAEIRAHFARYGIGERQYLEDLFDAFLSRPIDVTEEIEQLQALELES